MLYIDMRNYKQNAKFPKVIELRVFSPFLTTGLSPQKNH